MSSWFRVYEDLPSNPRVGTLSDSAFRTYIELLCHACKQNSGGDTGLTDETASWALRRDVTVTLQELLERSLIAKTKGGNYIVCNWDKRQFKSDSSADRTRAYREKKQAKQQVKNDNASCDVTETSQKRHSDALDTDTDTDTDTDQKKKKTSAASDQIALTADGEWVNVTDAQKALWTVAYPAVNMEAELAAAAAWIIANPANKKSNYKRFLTNWLKRAQDRAPRITPPSNIHQFEPARSRRVLA